MTHPTENYSGPYTSHIYAEMTSMPVNKQKALIVEAIITLIAPIMQVKKGEFLLLHHFSSCTAKLKVFANDEQKQQDNIAITMKQSLHDEISQWNPDLVQVLSAKFYVFQLNPQEIQRPSKKLAEKYITQLCMQNLSANCLENGMRGYLEMHLEGNVTTQTHALIDKIAKRFREICVKHLK